MIRNKVYTLPEVTVTAKHPHSLVNLNYPSSLFTLPVSIPSKYDNGLPDNAWYEDDEENERFIYHPSTRNYNYSVEDLKLMVPNAYRDRNASPDTWFLNRGEYVGLFPHASNVLYSETAGNRLNPWLKVLLQYNKDEYNRLVNNEPMSLYKADGGPISKWEDLSMKERHLMIRVGVANGLRDILSIKELYNSFAEGGKKDTISDNEYYSIMERVAKENWRKWGDPSEDAALMRILNDNSYNYRGYYNKYPNSRANADTHWKDEFKTVYHPTFSNESIYSPNNPNYIGKSQYNPNEIPGGYWISDTLHIPTGVLIADRVRRGYAEGGLLNKPFSYEEVPVIRYGDGGIIDKVGDFFGSTFNIPILAKGRTVKLNKDTRGNYTFNSRTPSEGYTYYDKNDGNTYKFINGKRTLIKLSLRSKESIKGKLFDDLTTRDLIIGNTKNHGIKNNETRGGWYNLRLLDNINPNDGITLIHAAKALPGYALYLDKEDTKGKYNHRDEALWKRHLGFERDANEMPYTNVRFTGDYDNNGNIRLPNAEYIGIPNYAKRTILEEIQKGNIDVDPTGKWSQREESVWQNSNDIKLQLYANFGIRENNNSGIYDVFDTYDFPDKWYMPDLNRLNGYQMEVRDTIWGPNAIPELYDTKFTKTKKKR